MSTPSSVNRVPAGTPSGGQFAASARSEAGLHLRVIDGEGSDGWKVPRDPFRALLPGMSVADDDEWRDLDEKAEGGLSVDALTRSEKQRYLDLAAKASEPGARNWMPQCPRHGGKNTSWAGDPGSWGADETCPACTDSDGNPLPLAARLTVRDRLTDEQVEEIYEAMLAAEKQSACNAVHVAASAALSYLTFSQDEHEAMDDERLEAVSNLDKALEDAQVEFNETQDADTYAETLKGIETNEAAAFDHLFPNDYDGAAERVEALQRAASDLADFA